MKWDLFISHASEDKDSFVRPLVRRLKELRPNISIWYDEVSLELGDSFRRKIEAGLANCRYGIVVLSKNYFAKEWPQKELDALVSREASGEKVVLPVWLDVGEDDIRRHSPLLADKVAVRSTEGVKKIAEQIITILWKNEHRPTPPESNHKKARTFVLTLAGIALLVAIIMVFLNSEQSQTPNKDSHPNGTQVPEISLGVTKPGAKFVKRVAEKSYIAPDSIEKSKNLDGEFLKRRVSGHTPSIEPSSELSQESFKPEIKYYELEIISGANEEGTEIFIDAEKQPRLTLEGNISAIRLTEGEHTLTAINNQLKKSIRVEIPDQKRIRVNIDEFK